jgi:hypothetical protein
MKKNLLIFTLIIISFTSCTSVRYHANYDIKLKNSTDDNCFLDDNIQICFTPTNKDINFILKNNTNQNIKLIWDEVLITIDSNESRVIHEGIRLIDKGKTQIPSIIYPNQTIKDIISPIENIQWVSNEGWDQSPLFIDCNYIKIQDYTKEIYDSLEFINIVKFTKNTSSIILHIPILINETTRKDYQFNFKINKATIKPIQVYDQKKGDLSLALGFSSSVILLLMILGM